MKILLTVSFKSSIMPKVEPNTLSLMKAHNEKSRYIRSCERDDDLMEALFPIQRSGVSY